MYHSTCNKRTNKRTSTYPRISPPSIVAGIHWPLTNNTHRRAVATPDIWIEHFSRVITPAVKRPKSRGRWRVAIVQRGTYYRRLQAYYDDRLLPSVSLPDSRLVTVIRSTSLAPLDQSRSGLCQNRSRSAIGIILLSDWFWLATLIREQRWCVALSRASVQRCELVGLRPSLRNLIIRLDYHHVVCLLSLSRYFSVFIRPNRYSLLRFRSFINSVFWYPFDVG